MKKFHKLFLHLIIIISSLCIIYFLVVDKPRKVEKKHINFSYKDGIFYKKNSDELFTGRIIDTADVIIIFEVSNGRKNGKFITYFLDGGIEKEGIMVDNKNQGTWKYYYDNGQIETIGNFSDNLPNGEWITYYKNGEIMVRGNYREGLQIGNWSYYDHNGNLINTVSYRDDVMIEKTIISI